MLKPAMPRPRAVALVALASLAAVLAGCAAAPAAGHHRPRTIGVAGTGKASARPDVAIAYVGAEARAPSLADAGNDVARRMTAVLAAVAGLGVQQRDITTVTYTVDPLAAPRPRGEEDPARIAGYRVTNVVAVKVRNLDTAGRVLDAAVAAGANVLRGVHFTLDDPAKARAEARARAVADAAAKAQQLAAAAGVRLGEVASITEGVAGPRPVVEQFALRSAVGGPVAPGPIESGELDVTVTVEVHYLIER